MGQLSSRRASLELLRIFPGLNLVVLLGRSVCSDVDLEICVFRFELLIEDIMSCGKDDVFRDEHSAAGIDPPVRVEESEGHY